jgi:hypothetical protein
MAPQLKVYAQLCFEFDLESSSELEVKGCVSRVSFVKFQRYVCGLTVIKIFSLEKFQDSRTYLCSRFLAE